MLQHEIDDLRSPTRKIAMRLYAAKVCSAGNAFDEEMTLNLNPSPASAGLGLALAGRASSLPGAPSASYG